MGSIDQNIDTYKRSTQRFRKQKLAQVIATQAHIDTYKRSTQRFRKQKLAQVIATQAQLDKTGEGKRKVAEAGLQDVYYYYTHDRSIYKA
jgi:tellurite resistance protein